MKGYSEDLRKRVVEGVEKGSKWKAVSKRYQVSQKSIARWLKQKKELGHVKPPKRGKKTPHKIKDSRLEGYISQYAQATLKEIGEELGASAEGVRKALKRLKITRKKRGWSIKKLVKRKEENTKRN